jgi:hypothetical protein
MKWLKKLLGISSCNKEHEYLESLAHEGVQLGRKLKKKVEKLDERQKILKEKIKRLNKKHK